MFKILFAVGFIGLFTGCESLDQKAQSWVGKHIDNAIVRFGAPSHVTKLSNGELFEWNKEGGTYGSVNNGFGQTNLMVDTIRCDIKMSIDEFKIIQQVYLEGSGC